ncbi:hybrid sensor histidine kinase/response regulator [Cellvibrio mixtus]|uniref:histidine kinase n=1 Tax=Cellvibrio mixtus TaxID=39650 RepID=A0A266Q4U6_9GAMM|nr:response regulator [Cellvibrio mixtus]OZY84893.1 hybrid sensor histidine kinase/response regulator [Cellvibrio mixtus]
MFHFFVPATKVQKDRAIMRETDARVAKYSRRGLVLNFIVFVLCLAFGNFQEKEHNLAIVLVTGLLLVTLVRSYYLFRFDSLYARAPARWRNQYFFASCLGAAWWSFILVTLTWVQGMRGETLVMWLYSVVFYSSVSNVFAPYTRFLSIYLAIGQVPAAITAIMLGTAQGALYGCIMLTFYIMLAHQGKVTSLAYWERLEAHFSLRERAQGLENEKRTSQAQIELKNEFLVNLGQEIRSSISDVMSTLSLIDDSQLSERHRELLAMANKATGRQIDLVNNVVDFSKITTKTLVLDEVEFDLRRVLEKFVQDFALDAHQQGVELYYSFDPTMPLRVRGDAARLNQILATLLNHTLKASRIEHVFIEARFHQDQDDLGELQVVISDSEKSIHPEADGESRESNYQGIGLSICKGLAECMGGSIHLRENKNRGNRIFINVVLQVVSHEDRRFGAEQKLRGKRALLVDLPDNNGNALADEVNAWGMSTVIVAGQEQTITKLREQAAAGSPFDLVLIFTKLNNMNGLAISREITQHPDIAPVKQIIAMSILQSDSPEMKSHLRANPQVSVIEKPIMRRRLHDVAVQKLLNTSADDERKVIATESIGIAIVPRVLLVEDHRVDQMVISAMLKKLGCYVQVAHNGLEAVEIVTKERFDLVLMDYDMKEQDSIVAAQKIRDHERSTHSKYHLPIVAVTSTQTEADQDVYLSAGMDDHIAKPIRYDDLEGRLQRWLEKA